MIIGIVGQDLPIFPKDMSLSLFYTCFNMHRQLVRIFPEALGQKLEVFTMVDDPLQEPVRVRYHISARYFIDLAYHISRPRAWEVSLVSVGALYTLRIIDGHSLNESFFHGWMCKARDVYLADLPRGLWDHWKSTVWPKSG